MRRVLALAVLVSGFVLVGWAAPVGAGSSRNRFSIDTFRAAPGTAVTAQSATPCPSGSAHAVVAMGTRRGTTDIAQWQGSVDAQGHWTIVFAVPAALSAGNYVVMADCRDAANSPLLQYRQVQLRVPRP